MACALEVRSASVYGRAVVCHRLRLFDSHSWPTSLQGLQVLGRGMKFRGSAANRTNLSTAASVTLSTWIFA